MLLQCLFHPAQFGFSLLTFRDEELHSYLLTCFGGKQIGLHYLFQPAKS